MEYFKSFIRRFGPSILGNMAIAYFVIVPFVQLAVHQFPMGKVNYPMVTVAALLLWAMLASGFEIVKAFVSFFIGQLVRD